MAARTLVLYGANLNAPIDNNLYNDENIESTPTNIAFKHKKHDKLPDQLKKCSIGKYSYNEWVKSMRSKYMIILEKCMYTIPTDVCEYTLDYWIDISRGAWLNDVWPLSVNE